MILAIFQNERVYEGNVYSLNAVYPMPSLSAVVIDEASQSGLAILGNPHPTSPPLFREDSFDPTTRVRRGRFYSVDSPSMRDWPCERINHYPYEQPTGGRPASYSMNAYRSLQPVCPTLAIRPLIFLGDPGYKTAWHLVGAERLFNSETLFTLKSANTLGALPELIEEKLPVESRKQIHDGFDKVVDAAHKYLPESIVDVCREYARVIVAAWLSTTIEAKTEGDDLARLIDAVPAEYVGVRSAAAIINRFHSRGKSSAREKLAEKGHDIRSVSDEDGDLSISLVGFLLREFVWAR